MHFVEGIKEVIIRSKDVYWSSVGSPASFTIIPTSWRWDWPSIHGFIYGLGFFFYSFLSFIIGWMSWCHAMLTAFLYPGEVCIHNTSILFRKHRDILRSLYYLDFMGCLRLSASLIKQRAFSICLLSSSGHPLVVVVPHGWVCPMDDFVTNKFHGNSYPNASEFLT